MIDEELRRVFGEPIKYKVQAPIKREINIGPIVIVVSMIVVAGLVWLHYYEKYMEKDMKY